MPNLNDFFPAMAITSTPVRVLVIDDDEVSRELLTVLLDAEGYSATGAESGEAALQLLAETAAKPSLILSDVQLPGIAGARLAEALRAACEPEAVLVAMSGSQPPQEEISGFDAFLLKPFEPGQLSAIYAEHRSGSRSEETPASAEQDASKSSMQISMEPPTDVPAVNETIYEQLAGAMPTAQLHEMYTMCLQDARDRINLMRKHAANRDHAQFVRQAHAIKGSCGMLGATQLHGMAAELEKTGLAPSDSQSQGKVNSLDELSAACDRLERMLGSRV